MVRIRQLGLPLGSAFIDPELRTQRTTLSYLDRGVGFGLGPSQSIVPRGKHSLGLACPPSLVIAQRRP
jgi:hypothetical protein